MGNKTKQNAEQNATEFATKRLNAKSIKTFYDDEVSERNRQNQTQQFLNVNLKKAAEIRNILQKAINANLSSGQKEILIDTSKRLYMTNPIYKDIVDYYANFFMYRYKVLPHKLRSASKVKRPTKSEEKNYEKSYYEMLEVVDGIGIETLYPEILCNLWVSGSVFFTTVKDESEICLSTLLLPNKYCRTIGQTQFGTSIIEFNVSYFDDILSNKDQDERYKYIANYYTEELAKLYKKYKNPNSHADRWQVLDPRFSTGILLNPTGIPYLLYILFALKNYEQYQDNELERNTNLLKYLVVQTMPHHQTDLIFTVDEVHDLHKSLRNKIEVGDNARLITTWGEVHVEKIGDNNDSENKTVEKAFKDIFNNAGLNSTIFTADSVEALKMALRKDKSIVYKYIEAITNFYIIAVNNGWDWKSYQADIEILPISNYTYYDDIEIYKTNATLGVNKLDYFIASGTKQKNIQDQLFLEDFLGFENLKPMQTSYTQSNDEQSSAEDSDQVKSEVEPADERTKE